MPYELFIGLRYLKSKKSQGLVSTNTILSILIVFLGVFILILVLSVMNGFQAAIKDKILDIDSHVTVTKLGGVASSRLIAGYRDLEKTVRAVPGVVSADGMIQAQGLFRFEENIIPVMIRGVGEKDRIPSDVKKFIVKGQKDFSRTEGVFIGQEMADSNGIAIGDTIELIVPQGELSVRTGLSPGMAGFKVIGLFKTQYYDFDTKLVIMSLPEAQKLYQVGDTVSGIGVKIRDVYAMNRMSVLIRDTIGFEYSTMTAEERNRNLFYALQLEKMIMMIILFLVIISASFTIMGTLVMVVAEKRKAVGILKSMGARPVSIMIIFILEGFFIGVIGSIAGVVLGIAASLNLDSIIAFVETIVNAVVSMAYRVFDLGVFTEISIRPTHVYYIEGIPTEVKPELVVFIATMAVFLSAIAALLPAWNASRLRPVETIRYE